MALQRLRGCWFSDLPALLLLLLLLLRPPATLGRERREPLAGRWEEAGASQRDGTQHPTYSSRESVRRKGMCARQERGGLWGRCAGARGTRGGSGGKGQSACSCAPTHLRLAWAPKGECCGTRLLIQRLPDFQGKGKTRGLQWDIRDGVSQQFRAILSAVLRAPRGRLCECGKAGSPRGGRMKTTPSIPVGSCTLG